MKMSWLNKLHQIIIEMDESVDRDTFSQTVAWNWKFPSRRRPKGGTTRYRRNSDAVSLEDMHRGRQFIRQRMLFFRTGFWEYGKFQEHLTLKFSWMTSERLSQKVMRSRSFTRRSWKTHMTSWTNNWTTSRRVTMTFALDWNIPHMTWRVKRNKMAEQKQRVR